MKLTVDPCWRQIQTHSTSFVVGPRMHSIYQPLWHIPVYLNAVWISQRWKCVQQDAGRGHEEGGQGIVDVLPGWHLDSQLWTLGSFRTFERGSLGIPGSWNQDKTLQDPKLFQSEVEYLGRKFSKGGVSMILEYIQKITDWPVPRKRSS